MGASPSSSRQAAAAGVSRLDLLPRARRCPDELASALLAAIEAAVDATPQSAAFVARLRAALAEDKAGFALAASALCELAVLGDARLPLALPLPAAVARALAGVQEAVDPSGAGQSFAALTRDKECWVQGTADVPTPPWAAEALAAAPAAAPPQRGWADAFAIVAADPKAARDFPYVPHAHIRTMASLVGARCSVCGGDGSGDSGKGGGGKGGGGGDDNSDNDDDDKESGSLAARLAALGLGGASALPKPPPPPSPASAGPAVGFMACRVCSWVECSRCVAQQQQALVPESYRLEHDAVEPTSGLPVKVYVTIPEQVPHKAAAKPDGAKPGAEGRGAGKEASAHDGPGVGAALGLATAALSAAAGAAASGAAHDDAVAALAAAAVAAADDRAPVPADVRRESLERALYEGAVLHRVSRLRHPALPEQVALFRQRRRVVLPATVQDETPAALARAASSSSSAAAAASAAAATLRLEAAFAEVADVLAFLREAAPPCFIAPTAVAAATLSPREVAPAAAALTTKFEEIASVVRLPPGAMMLAEFARTLPSNARAAQLAPVVRDIASALAALHAAGINHNDVDAHSVLCHRAGPGGALAGVLMPSPSTFVRGLPVAPSPPATGLKELVCPRPPEPWACAMSSPAADAFALGNLITFAVRGKYPVVPGQVRRWRTLDKSPHRVRRSPSLSSDHVGTFSWIGFDTVDLGRIIEDAHGPLWGKVADTEANKSHLRMYTIFPAHHLQPITDPSPDSASFATRLPQP